MLGIIDDLLSSGIRNIWFKTWTTCKVIRWPDYELNIWQLSTLKFSPIAFKIWKGRLMFCQILNKPSWNGERFLICCQSGEISPNLVTLATRHTLKFNLALATRLPTSFAPWFLCIRRNQCDQMLRETVGKFFCNLHKKYPQLFLHNNLIGLFQNSPIIQQSIWATFVSNFVAKNFEKSTNLVSLDGSDWPDIYNNWQSSISNARSWTKTAKSFFNNLNWRCSHPPAR